MTRLVVSAAAAADLKAIADYTEAQWGPAQKQHYLTALQDCFAILRDNPTIGALRDDISPDLRSLPCGSHVVFFRGTAAAVRIVRVLHHRMDVRRHLAE